MKRTLALLFILSFSFISCAQSLGSPQTRDNTDLLSKKNEIEKEGRNYEMHGELDQAIIKYDEAAQLDFKIYGSNKGRPLAFKAEALQKIGKYKEALEILNGLLEAHPQQENYVEWKKELEALVKCTESGEMSSVYDYIEKYKERYQADLPPKGHSTRAIPIITRIFSLYDIIGDYDAGVAYVDEIVNWTLDTDKEFKDLKGIRSTEGIGDRYEWKGPGKTDKNRWALKWLREYFLVREAFLQDKAEGKRGSMKEGKPGRATMALIQSDYFPW